MSAHHHRPASGGAPSKPRPSASLIVINPKNEILLVCRAPKASIYAGAHVFPGGNYDPRHDSTFADTAVRETFEETGLLLATASLTDSANSASNCSKGIPLNDEDLNIGRESIHSHKETFKGFLTRHGLKIDESSLLPFSQWVTPPNYPRRFQTQFYVYFLDDSQSQSSLPGFSLGGNRGRVPIHDGGQEVIEARFVHPLTAVEEFRKNKITLLTPQFYLIVTLSEILTTGEMSRDQRAKILELSNGTFGRMCLHPLELVTEDKSRVVFTYEGDEARGGKAGCKHRNTARFNEDKTLTVEDIMERDIDIFTGIDQRWWQSNSKL